MSGLAIQSPSFMPPRPAAAPAWGAVAGGMAPASAAVPGEAGNAASGPADALDLSALARALEKLAQAPGADGPWLAKLMTLAQNQGELLQFLGALNAPGGGAGMPTEVAEALKALGALGSATGEGRVDGTPGAAGGSGDPDDRAAGSGREMFQALPGKVSLAVGQALLNLMAPVKESLGSLGLAPAPAPSPVTTAPEPPSPTGGSLPGMAGGATGTPGAAPTANSISLMGNVAELKAGLAQFVQAQVAQVTDLIRTLGAQVPGLAGLAGNGAEGAMEIAGKSPAMPGAPSGATVLAQPGANPAAAELAGALRQLAAAGELLASPPLRQDYISTTLGRVSALLSEPAFAEALRQPGLAQNPLSAPASAVAAGMTTAANVPDSQRPAGVLGALLSPFAPLPTSAEGESFPLPLPLAGDPSSLGRPEAGAPNENARSPERLAEMMRQGTRFAAVALDTPGLPPLAAAPSNVMTGKTQSRRGDPVRTAPDRIAAKGEGEKRVTASEAHGGVHDKLKSASVAVNGEKSSANGTATESRARVAQDLFTAFLFSSGEGREAPGPDQARDPAARMRLEQYSHPEAFRLNPLSQQAAASVQLAVFFQSHREEALTGQPFEAGAEEQASPARLLLEYKPIEILRPGRSTPASAQSADSQSPPPPVIDVQPLSVQRH